MPRTTNILQVTNKDDLVELNRILKEIQLRLNDLGGANGRIELNSDVVVMGQLQLAEQQQQRPILTDEVAGQVVFQPKEGQAPEAQFQVAEETVIDDSIDQRVHRLLDVVQRAAKDGVDKGKASTFNFQNMDVVLDLDNDRMNIQPLPSVIYFPTTMTVVAGTLAAGTVDDVKQIGAGFVQINEVGGPPGWDVIFDFTTVANPNLLWVHYYYTGNHNPDLEMWNYATSAWVSLATLDTGMAGFASITVPITSDYVSSGAARVRFYHAVAGNPTHKLFIDYVAISSGGVDPSQIDHGALAGLLDDDHTQYLTVARHNAIDAADHGSDSAAASTVLTADGAGGASWQPAVAGAGLPAHVISVDTTIDDGKTETVVRYIEINANITLTIGVDSDLEVL